MKGTETCTRYHGNYFLQRKTKILSPLEGDDICKPLFCSKDFRRATPAVILSLICKDASRLTRLVLPPIEAKLSVHMENQKCCSSPHLSYLSGSTKSDLSKSERI